MRFENGPIAWLPLSKPNEKSICRPSLLQSPLSPPQRNHAGIWGFNPRRAQSGPFYGCLPAAGIFSQLAAGIPALLGAQRVVVGCDRVGPGFRAVDRAVVCSGRYPGRCSGLYAILLVRSKPAGSRCTRGQHAFCCPDKLMPFGGGILDIIPPEGEDLLWSDA